MAGITKKHSLDTLIAGVEADIQNRSTWIGQAVLYLLKKEKQK